MFPSSAIGLPQSLKYDLLPSPSDSARSYSVNVAPDGVTSVACPVPNTPFVVASTPGTCNFGNMVSQLVSFTIPRGRYIITLRRQTLCKSFSKISSIPHLASDTLLYARTLIRLLRTPDRNRFSHAIWYGRPFQRTTLAVDALMPTPNLSSAVLTQLRYHIPSLLQALLDGAIELWNKRCKLTYPKPPVPVPFQPIPKHAFRLQRSLRRAQKNSRQAPAKVQKLKKPPKTRQSPHTCTEATIGWPLSLSDVTNTNPQSLSASTAAEEPLTGISLPPYASLSPLSPVRSTGYDGEADFELNFMSDLPASPLIE